MKQIIDALLNKKIGIFPCDTVWGIIGILDDSVAKTIQEIKHRKNPKPLICLIKDKNQLEKYAKNITGYTYDIINDQWPGSLSIIVNKADSISNTVTAGKESVCLRVPDFEPLNQLLNEIDQPIISTSCNLTNKEIPKKIEQIDPLIIDNISFFYDKAEPKEGVASKIIDCTGNNPIVVRQ
jgi:L-threonylcarbamoyladenylate synthase